MINKPEISELSGINYETWKPVRIEIEDGFILKRPDVPSGGGGEPYKQHTS
jgi:hypothetical protein